MDWLETLLFFDEEAENNYDLFSDYYSWKAEVEGWSQIWGLYLYWGKLSKLKFDI